jgi:hypothetical protein
VYLLTIQRVFGLISSKKICQYNENHMKKGARQTFDVQCISKYLRLLTLFNIIQWNLRLVKSCTWENYICYIDSLLFWKTLKFENDSYEHVEHWKRDKIIMFNSNKTWNFLSAVPVSSHFLVNYCRNFCSPLHGPECFSWSLWNAKDLPPCWNSMDPTYTSFKSHLGQKVMQRNGRSFL